MSWNCTCGHDGINPCDKCKAMSAMHLAAGPITPSRAVEAVPGLDVAALQRAIHTTLCDRPPGYALHEPGNGARCQLGGVAFHEQLAEEYAAARLRGASEQPEPDGSDAPASR